MLQPYIADCQARNLFKGTSQQVMECRGDGEYQKDCDFLCLLMTDFLVGCCPPCPHHFIADVDLSMQQAMTHLVLLEILCPPVVVQPTSSYRLATKSAYMYDHSRWKETQWFLNFHVYVSSIPFSILSAVSSGIVLGISDAI